MLVGGLIIVLVASATVAVVLVHTRRVREGESWRGTRARGWTPDALATLAVDDPAHGLGPDGEDTAAEDAVVVGSVPSPA